MAPMKAMKGPIKVMTKSAIAKAIAEEHEIKAGVAAKIISPSRDWYQGGDHHGQIHVPWPRHGEDPRQAGNQGLQEGDLRENVRCKGPPGQDSREGLPRLCVEEERMRVPPQA